MKKLSLIFVGTGEFGCPILEALAKDNRFDILFIITAPDKKSGRGLKTTLSPVKNIGIANKLFIQQPKAIQEIEQKIIQALPDFLLVTAYGEIIKESILKIPKLGSVNIHASLLPKYRGASPIHEALLQGDPVTGITWILMNKKIDQGDIISSKTTDINPSDTYLILSEKLAELAAKYTGDVLVKYAQEGKKEKQNSDQASYCRKINKEDGLIDVYKENAQEIERKSKAYYPWPGCYLIWRKKRLKIIKTGVGEQKIDAGEVFIMDGGNLAIGTKEKTLEPQIVQMEGKNQITIEEFLRGQKEIPKKL